MSNPKRIDGLDLLLEIQNELPKIGKDGNNPYFNSSYLTLEKLLDVLRPILASKKILLLQYPSYRGDNATLKTKLYHNGALLHTSEMLLASKATDPQAQGSAITYARRYALMTIFGIVPAETDDDGNSASPAPIEKAMTQTQWKTLGELLEIKGIKARDDKIALIRALAGDKPLNTSAFSRLEKEIKEAQADTLQDILMEAK